MCSQSNQDLLFMHRNSLLRNVMCEPLISHVIAIHLVSVHLKPFYVRASTQQENILHSLRGKVSGCVFYFLDYCKCIFCINQV